MTRRICLVWLGAGSLGAQEGRLERARQEINREDPSPSPQTYAEGEEDGIVAEFLSRLFLGLLASGPSPSSDGIPSYNCFTPYPYCERFPGYRTPSSDHWPHSLSEWEGRLEPRGWSARVSAENGNDFSGLNRANGQFLLETAAGIGFLTSWNHFYERLSGGRSDEMVIGDVNVIGSLGLGCASTVRAGLGFRTALDHGDSDWGFNFHLGADFFPVRPFVLSISGDVGTLGSAGVWHGRCTLGAMYRGWEVFGGYDALSIGGEVLHGPLVGVRLWF
jgi:hypothetical protein